MAKTDSKPAFPSKPCPRCGELIHARSKSHVACGWNVDAAAPVPVASSKRGGKRKKPGRPAIVRAGSSLSTISLDDIRAVKAVVDKLGAEKVRQLAAVLTR